MTMTDTNIARVCHEANRALQVIQADPGIAVAVPWDEVTTEMQESVVSGVYGVRRGVTPEESHESWCDFKRQGGWVYGRVKDEAARTHPCLMPYSELSDSQRLKDDMFSAIVKVLARA